MPNFPLLGDRAMLPNILRLHPQAWGAPTEYHQIVMRGPSALSERRRELIAAYVARLNDCQYRHGVKGNPGVQRASAAGS